MGPTSPVDFILQPPVFHPVLPYITTIFGGLTRGKMVLVQGVVLAEAERFQVDFQCGCSVMPRPDIAIHFNPRFRSQPHVICNTLQNGRWLEETKFPHLPLKRGEAFQLLFLFGQDEVQVSVNGQHFLQYRSRLPLARVDTVGVFGDIMVKSMAFLRSNPFDASRTEYPVAHPMQLNSSKLAVPYCHPLPRGLASRDTIIVRGLVCPVPEGFSLSLREDPSHVPLRLSTCFRTRALMWSSFPDGALSHTEKVAACFPFHPQRFFELLLVCEEGSFKLALNGIPLGQYDTPWLSWDRITELWIEGDVTLYSVLS
ncbi:galectin-12 isoform X1 [Trachemys scripta elegans]|uniref:galectin-12 isoform X1 n=3 Tax=Trachemys scripta elegans TaxID=31138 RepID=UPI0015570ED4|nr:galectin-12 isoform X1 [Trachemys scripta elegans]